MKKQSLPIYRADHRSEMKAMISIGQKADKGQTAFCDGGQVGKANAVLKPLWPFVFVAWLRKERKKERPVKFKRPISWEVFCAENNCAIF